MTKEEALSRGRTMMPIERNTLNRSEALEIARALQTEANKVMKGVRQIAPEGTPATRGLLKSLHQYSTKSYIGAKSIKISSNASINELRNVIASTQRFLDPGRTQLYSVERSKQYIEQLERRLPGYSDLTARNRKDFWDVYEDLTNLSPARGEKGNYGSEWTQLQIMEIIEEDPSKLKNFEELKKALEERLDAIR